jgi:osmotically-inducible protein OsmY
MLEHMNLEQATGRWGAAMCAAALCLCLCLCLASQLTACVAVGDCGFSECPPDAQISAAVRALLAQSPALGAPNLISVRTRRGVVYLQGLVSTPYQIAAAGSAAAQAPGVISVENLLAIDNAH